jgi:hypothetical protein
MVEILAYMGGLLVSFQIVGKIGYASSFIVIPLAYPIKPLFNKIKKSDTRKKRFGWWVLFIFYTILFLSIGTVLSPIMIFYFLIARPLLEINSLINIVFRKSLEPWKDFYFSLLHFQLKLYNTESQKSDDEIWKNTMQREIPFLAFIGVILITVSFIIKLAS